MLEIRERTDEDLDETAAVHVRGWQSGYAGIIPAGWLAELRPADWVERYRRRMAAEPHRALVAVEDGRIVGLATFGAFREDGAEPDSRIGELWAIYVDPDQWGKGTGHRLIGAAKRELAAQGFVEMRLWVLTDNVRARRFYEREGLRPDGTTQTWTPRGTTVELPELRYGVAL